MAFQVSPGIVVREFDISTYVPGVSTTVAGIGGVFSWGPVEDRELISSETELAVRFGKPTDDNYETFMIAANFLAYSDALYVTRAADANAFNAVANSGVVANTQIKNETDYTTKAGSLSANSHFYAKYPGVLGNSLKISICASANAYQSAIANASANTTLSIAFVPGTFTGTVTVEDTVETDNAVAVADLTAILADVFVGDYVTASNNSIGTQFLKVSAIGSPAATANGIAEATITFSNRYTLSDTITSSTITRNWEYFQLVNKSPGTSQFTENRGGVGDELHVVISDEDGLFTGTPGAILEVWESLSRATDSKTESGTENYYYDVLNNSSLYVWGATAAAGITANTAENMAAITIDPYTASFSRGTDSLSESSIPLSALARAYDQYKNPEEIDISIIIAGKAIGGSYGEGVANYIIDNIADVRRDLVVTTSPQLADVVNNPFQEEESLIQFRNALRSSSYAMMTSSYKYQFDRYNNKYRWVAGCGDDAGIIARTDYDRDPWWSPAGQSRGQYKNLIKLAYNPDKSARDVLYKSDINSVVTQVGAGTILYGDKTLLGRPSAFDRINVRRLFITLEKAISKASKDLLFEFNDEFTRARFRNMVEPFLRDVMGRRGITRFKVICDETNNTPTVIDRNEFVGSIFIVPAKSINYIQLDFYAVANAFDFNYVTGQLQ